MVVGHLKQGTRERNKDTETKKVAMMIINIMIETSSYLAVEAEDSRTVGHSQAQAVGHSQEEEEL